MEENLKLTWNEQLNDWFASSGKKVSDISKAGIPDGTFYDYRTGRVKDLSKVSERNKRILYELTGIECFKAERYGQESPGPEARLEESTEDLSSAIRELRRATHLLESAVESRGSRILKARVYSPTPKERADGVMQLIDILAEEVDYYRTASPEERQVLVGRLKENAASFGYATQILNALHDGKSIDSWMMMTQAPSRIRRAINQGHGKERK